MEQKDKELLIKDLSARLPYEPWVWFKENWETNPNFKGCQSQLRLYHLEYIVKDIDITLKPYLRSLSSMTEEEKVEYEELEKQCESLPTFAYISVSKCVLFDWLNKHHFDYRNLIMGGLAIEAPKGMYK